MARTDSIDYGLCYECNGEGTIRQASGGILNVATVTCEVCGGSGRMGAEEEAAVVARVDLSDIPMPHVTLDPDAHAALVARSKEQDTMTALMVCGYDDDGYGVLIAEFSTFADAIDCAGRHMDSGAFASVSVETETGHTLYEA